MIGRHSEAEASAEGAHLVDGRLAERRRNMRIRRFMAEAATFLFVAMMVVSAVVGVFAAVWPALRASRLPVLEAIATE